MAIAIFFLALFGLFLVWFLGAAAARMRRQTALRKNLIQEARRLSLTQEQTDNLLNAASPRPLAEILSESLWIGLFVALYGTIAALLGRSLYAGQLAVGLYLGGSICMAMGFGLVLVGAGARFAQSHFRFAQPDNSKNFELYPE
jgi:hypothetical protein